MGLLVENDLDCVAARSTIAQGIASSPRLVHAALDFAAITINYSSHRYAGSSSCRLVCSHVG